ncbi:MAG: EMC3/TMCO1 family protein [Candidatus ainarchaeum sp.]|nr:EMC3/TMCO1 family protein [Candidatus ainarchaeum sp.]
MVFETFIALVAFLALAYAGTTRYLQTKLVDKKAMEEMQSESKRLSKEFDDAKKSGNQKRIDEAMKQQMEFLPKMNKVMMGQMKMMFVVLFVFAAFMWVVGYLDPSVQDDIKLNMSDDGSGCDQKAGDGIYSACYKLEGTNYGKWTALVKAYESGVEMGSNETYFIYKSDGIDTYVDAAKGQPISVETDKQLYETGETIVMYASPPAAADNVQVTLSNGTYFSVELPFTIPVFNVKTIYQPYWWFIFISIIASLGSTLVMSVIQKKGGKKA